MTDSKITDLTDGGAVITTDEFVVARSGSNRKISGSRVSSSHLISVVQYAPASLATYNVTNTSGLTALDTTNLTTTSFTVPDSGAVLVDFYTFAQSDSSGVLGLAILNHSGGAQIGYTLSNFASSVSLETGLLALLGRWYLSGLSAGSLQLDIAAGTTTGNQKLYAQGNTGAVNSGKVGPNLIVVQAA